MTNIEKELFRLKMIDSIINDAWKYLVISERTKNRRIKRKQLKRFEKMRVLFSIWSY